MKNKSLLSIEKMAMRNENEKMAILKSQESTLIQNTVLLYKEKYKKFLIFSLCKLLPEV